MSNDLAKQPALRRWQESVYGKGPHQVPDYESMAAIVQEHEQMAARIEELEADLRKMALDYLAAEGQAAEAYQAQLAAEHKLAKAVVALTEIRATVNGPLKAGRLYATYDRTKMEAALEKITATLAKIGEGHE